MKESLPQPDQPAIDIELSVIKLFGYIQKDLQQINTPPLTAQALEVNADAYAELGSDNNPEEGLVFARISMDFPKRYTDIPFSMIFDINGVALSVAGQDFVFAPFQEIGSNERDIATKLINILVGLANGQLAILNTMTQDNEKVQAWELLYRKPGNSLYDALATYALFDSARKLKSREMVTEKFANTADIKDVDVDIETFKLFTFETNWLTKFNRTQIAGLHVPLTREDWEKSVDKYYDDKADAFVEKVDQWATKDKRSFKQQVLDAAKWRHLELMWWSLALMLYKPVSAWSLEYFHPSMVIFGLFVIAATIYRRNKKFYHYYPWIRPLAYVGFFLASILFISQHDNSAWWIVLCVFAAISLAENIFFDARETYTSRTKSSNNK